MDREPHAPENEKEYYQRILSLAAFFHGEFNVDWLQYLSQGKASQIFAALQFGVRKKWLADKNDSVFCFINPSIQSRLQGTLTPDEQKALHRRIADLLLAVHAELRFAYRSSALLSSGEIVVAARLRLPPGDAAAIAHHRNFMRQGQRC